jgi:tRNA modification GTPase
VAISTPPGHSGIGVVRVSGAKCREIGQRCFDSRSGTHTFEHRVAAIGIWSDAAGNRIDEVVVTYFAAPRSYTGEDVLEISATAIRLYYEQ